MIVEIILILLCIILFFCFLYERDKKKDYMNRYDAETLELEESNQMMDSIFCNVHAYILLIDDDFVVLKTNYYLLTDTIASFDKKRVGDLLKCHNAMCAIGGCGTGDFCKRCPIRAAIQHAFDTSSNFTNLEDSLEVMNDDDTSLKIDASISGRYFMFDDKPRMVLTVQDITELKKAKMLQSNT